MPGGGLPLRGVGSRAGAVTYVSHWCQGVLEPAFGSGPLHELLPPAVDPEVFHAGVDGTEVRRRHALEGVPLMVCVSRLVERKGQDTVIAAFDEVRRRVPDAHLLVVGDGPHRAALESQAARAGHADRVVFTGSVPDAELAAHYAAGDVFAMPCRERKGGLEVEAFGIVFIQAEAVGVPVVAGNIGGVPDALVDGRTGLLVDPTDTAAGAEAHVQSRCFALGAEDPVCAAAHAGLACFWAAAEDAPAMAAAAAAAVGGSLRAWQASPRGGLLLASIDAAQDGTPEWVRLRGACRTMVDGALTDDALRMLYPLSAA
jgi:phosphatidylinositol alpha-1,6-mannosyltransferase